MKFNIKKIKLNKKSKFVKENDQDAEPNLIFGKSEQVKCVDTIQKDGLLAIRITKMKRSNANSKLHHNDTKSLTLRSIGVSVANLFKPNKRIAMTDKKIEIDNNIVNLQLNQHQAISFVPTFDPTKSDQRTPMFLKRQEEATEVNLKKLSGKSQTLTNMLQKENEEESPTKKQYLTLRKNQPSMGIKVQSLKANKHAVLNQSIQDIDEWEKKFIDQAAPFIEFEKRDLIPFLDSINFENPPPLVSSTFNLANDECDCLMATKKVTLIRVSPISTRSKAKKISKTD